MVFVRQLIGGFVVMCALCLSVQALASDNVTEGLRSEGIGERVGERGSGGISEGLNNRSNHSLSNRVQDDAKIVVSIKPLQLLVNEIRGDNANTLLLLRNNQNHHLRHLKPSQRQMIHDAKHVFYISDEFETYLQAIKRADASAVAAFKYIELGQLSGIRLLSARASGELPNVDDAHAAFLLKQQSEQDGQHSGHDEHAHGHAHEEHGHQSTEGGHHDDVVDWHLWLNPDNAIVMLGKIRDVMTELNPNLREHYASNHRNAVIRITQQSQRIAEKMMEVMKVPFITLHDGYQYFEEQYGLNSLGSVLRHEDDKTSVKQVREMRQLIAKQGVQCVFKEVQYSAKPLRPILQGNEAVMVVELDSLGQSLESSQQTVRRYTDLMENFAGRFYRSLATDL